MHTVELRRLCQEFIGDEELTPVEPVVEREKRRKSSMNLKAVKP